MPLFYKKGRNMDVFLYGMLFIMGTFFGSFFTLAVYRIPLKKDITHEHSFCPQCNHKLGIWDLIPVWSYLALKGKCRYCGEKVRIRYLLLEVLSGLVFVIAYASFHIENVFLQTQQLMAFVAFVFTYVTLVLVAGIDKEHRMINHNILLFGMICQSIYILYLYIIEETSVYRYIIYVILFLILYIILLFQQKKKTQDTLQVLLFLAYLQMVIQPQKILFIIVLTSLLVFLWKKSTKKEARKIPVGFFLSIFSILTILIGNWIEFWK